MLPRVWQELVVTYRVSLGQVKSVERWQEMLHHRHLGVTEVSLVLRVRLGATNPGQQLGFTACVRPLRYGGPRGQVECQTPGAENSTKRWVTWESGCSQD